MNRRAKAIGVHKCSGANTGTIFGMFLWETGVIMLFSLLLVALLLFNFREPLEDMLDVSLAGLFLLGKHLGTAFSDSHFVYDRRHVARAAFCPHSGDAGFRRYTEGKKGWKRPLLFVQFAGTSFIFGLLGWCLCRAITSPIKNVDSITTGGLCFGRIL